MQQAVTHVNNISDLNKFYAKVYGLVAGGIGLSAFVSFLTINLFLHQLINLASNPVIFYGLWIGELILVWVASSAAAKNKPTALPLFIIYAILNGITLSVTLLFYTGQNVLGAFLTTTAMFVGLSIVGVTIKKDLSGMARALIAGVIGLIVASIVNIFIGGTTLSLIISIVGVLIFSGLIAYDSQKVRQIFEQTNGNVPQGWAVSMGIGLYLDFINMFLYILRIIGGSLDDSNS